MMKQIELPLCGRPILLITHMIRLNWNLLSPITIRLLNKFSFTHCSETERGVKLPGQWQMLDLSLCKIVGTSFLLSLVKEIETLRWCHKKMDTNRTAKFDFNFVRQSNVFMLESSYLFSHAKVLHHDFNKKICHTSLKLSPFRFHAKKQNKIRQKLG